MVYNIACLFFACVFYRKIDMLRRGGLIWGDFEPGEEGFELVEGHGVEAEIVCALEGQPVVRNEFAQLAQIACTADVLHWCDLPEVVEAPIHLVTVDVVDLHAFGTRTDEGLPHQMMTETAAEMAHTWVRSAMRVRFVTSHRRTKTRFEFFTGSIVKLAVRACEEDLAACTLRRNLFYNWYIHLTASSEGFRTLNVRRLVPNWRCKSTAIA